MKRIARMAARLMLLTSVAMACTAEPRDTTVARTKVRASAQRYLGHAIAYLGVEDSLFAREGLDLEIVTPGNAS